MWKVDPDGGFQFSDATNPNQLVLFEADPTALLLEELRKEFAGKGIVTGEQIRKFVENKTAYLKAHNDSCPDHIIWQHLKLLLKLLQEKLNEQLETSPTNQTLERPFSPWLHRDRSRYFLGK